MENDKAQLREGKEWAESDNREDKYNKREAELYKAEKTEENY